MWLTGEYFADSLALEEGVTAADIEVALRNILFCHRLRAQFRVDERRHLAVALHDVDVNLFRGKGLDVCEEGIPQKRMYRRRGAHHFGQVSRLVNVNLVRPYGQPGHCDHGGELYAPCAG